MSTCRPVDLVQDPVAKPNMRGPSKRGAGAFFDSKVTQVRRRKIAGMFWGSLHGIASGKLTYIYMENGPNRNRWFIQIVIFNSHVKLPEGNPLVI